MPNSSYGVKFYLFFVLVLLIAPELVTRSQTREQLSQPVQSKPTVAPAPAVTSSTDIFLKLADSVGQGIPAKRLVEYKLKNDPTGKARYWAVVDFNQNSTRKRFYIFDTQENTVESYYVAHGKGSEGAMDDGMAEVFSNEEGSSSSSLGIYRTLDEYVGGHGRSLRLQGLEPTNSNAYERAVVLHRADYVSEDFIRQTGRIGRSDGCLAVEQSAADTLIDKLKNGAYIIAWKK
jgi:hypothetical protein